MEPRTEPTGEAATQAKARAPWHELGMMGDPILDQVLLFYLGHAWQGLSDIGECLETARRVDPCDEASWSIEWTRTAHRLRRMAERSEAGGHTVSARQAWMRAATYFRAALHRHPDPADPNVARLAESARAAFVAALRLGSAHAEEVRIPYEGTTLPAYFFRSPRAERAPLLIVHQGRDAWAEDCKYLADGAVARGFNCLLFDGPGQGKALRLQGLVFRPDWESVVGPVIDWASAQPSVDSAHLALMGLSMGGALAARAAAFEPRIELLVTNPGVYEWSAIFFDFVRSIDPGLPTLLATDPKAFDARLGEVMQAVPLVRWGLRDTMWKHGADSPSDALLGMRAYDNAAIAGRIRCRTLVMDGAADPWAQSQRFFDALRAPKDLMRFDPVDAAETHVQTGALAIGSERMFDWLEDAWRA